MIPMLEWVGAVLLITVLYLIFLAKFMHKRSYGTWSHAWSNWTTVETGLTTNGNRHRQVRECINCGIRKTRTIA